ncbi:methylenetetrahydrofolate reductase [Photobacterium chitinilyticum]|uniref:Methylenetetrahydrofolate reductase n=1 Tax=Photobacterium chitinilyticum TaxID=2485123 RepID=A0A444JRS8_9GAMM|nr:methylenetetrahydrofolate reductase [Photobacterium chitinilyticum]RWX55821.1 methylenetetrahydrofolate reductase [Photobacterium chitinilyticum]
MKCDAYKSLGGEGFREPDMESDIEPRLLQLLAEASLEATPKQVLKLHTAPDWLSAGTWVYVPFLPKGRFEETFEACERLLLWGMVPIPHIPARAVPSEACLHRWLSSLTHIGVYNILLIAGERKPPAGPFSNTLALLASGALAKHPLRGIGVAGHPEGHPHATSYELTNALAFKREYAETNQLNMWVVTQFSFDADIFIQWLECYRELLGSLPVYLGMPGPTQLKNLLFYAAQCGVVESVAALRRNLKTTQLLKPWTPDLLVQEMARYQTINAGTPFQGIHLYPFGGLKQSAKWLRGAH